MFHESLPISFYVTFSIFSEHLVPVLDLLVSRIALDGVCDHFYKRYGVNRLIDWLESGNFAISLCACRLVSNSFACASGTVAILEELAMVMCKVAQFCLNSEKVSAQNAFGAVLANVAVVATRNAGQKLKILKSVIAQLPSWLDESGNLTDVSLKKMLVCLGTIMFGDPTAIAFAKELCVAGEIRKLKDKAVSEDVKHLARTLEAMMS